MLALALTQWGRVVDNCRCAHGPPTAEARTWTWAVPHSRTRSSVGSGRGQHGLHAPGPTRGTPKGPHPGRLWVLPQC